MLDDTQLQHLFVDLRIADAPLKRIANQIKKDFKVTLSANYVGMILRGERTGYRYRGMIAHVLGRKEEEIFSTHKKPRRRATTEEGIPSRSKRFS